MLWPDKIWPQDIGALCILDGANLTDADGRFRIETIRAAIAARLHLLPRLRQQLYVPPPRLGGPLWIDARSFNLDDHLQVMRVPPPGGEAELLQVTEGLRRRGLDRSRPLWEMWFLTGLPEGRVGWFVKLHHCIADGIAGIATLGAFLDASPNVSLPQPQPWTPATAPSEFDLLEDHRRLKRSYRRRALRSLAHPLVHSRELAASWPALSELIADGAVPPTSLERMVGPGRRFALICSRLEMVRAIAHGYDAKVNDVLLTAIAGGLHRLLQDRGELSGKTVVRAYVPVTLRPPDQRDNARGNRIAQMVVPLPVGETDPVQRLRLIAAETTRRKARRRPDVGKLPYSGITGRALLMLIARQHVNVATADLVGPPVPLYLAGARLLEVFPVLPLLANASLGVGALSYAGQFNITAVGDLDGYPDLELFAAGLGDELAELALTVGASGRAA